MSPVKIVIVFLFFIESTCLSDALKWTIKPAEPTEVVDAVMEILTSCYGKKGDAIGLVGKFPDNFLPKLWLQRLIPIVSIDNSTRFTQNSNKRDVGRGKLETFVVGASSLPELHRLIQLKRSPWHNHMASYLILDWSPIVDGHGCERIDEKLYFLWENFIYNTNVVCLHPTEKTVKIYGYNPHKNEAPKPWKLIKSFKKQPTGYFTVFERDYHADEKICHNLDFDKTANLNGDVIYFSDLVPAERKNELYPSKGIHLDLYVDMVYNYVNLYGRQVNATFEMHYMNHRQPIIKDIYHVHAVCLGSPLNCPILYPVFDPIGQLIMTKFRGYKSQLSKILGVVDIYSQIAVVLVLLITVLFFKFVVHQTAAQAILNVIRMVCNTGFTNLPHDQPRRVCLGCLLFFALTMLGIFTGNLASLLTLDIPLRHPETMKDLVDLGYTIYIEAMNSPHFNDPMYKDRVITKYPNESCSEIVLKDPYFACISTDHHVKNDQEASEFDLHVSSNPVIRQYCDLGVADDWPFLDRTNNIFGRIHEACIGKPLKVRLKEIALREAKIEEMNYYRPKVMTFKNLRFAFVILGIGLGCATICFFAEIAIDRRSRRVVKLRRKM